MAKVFGILSDATTGFTSIGKLTDYTETATAEVAYGRAAAGNPDADNGGILGPKTMSGKLEIDGTVPAAKTTITVGTTTYILTSVSKTYVIDGVATCDIEGTERFSTTGA